MGNVLSSLECRRARMRIAYAFVQLEEASMHADHAARICWRVGIFPMDQVFAYSQEHHTMQYRGCS